MGGCENCVWVIDWQALGLFANAIIIPLTAIGGLIGWKRRTSFLHRVEKAEAIFVAVQRVILSIRSARNRNVTSTEIEDAKKRVPDPKNNKQVIAQIAFSRVRRGYDDGVNLLNTISLSKFYFSDKPDLIGKMERLLEINMQIQNAAQEYGLTEGEAKEFYDERMRIVWQADEGPDHTESELMEIESSVMQHLKGFKF